MLYSIENDRLRVEINDIGAELYSIKDKADGFEYLWQGDPQYWSGRAYNLFPICGRITEGRYTYKGGSYDICLHGFARDAAFTCVEQGGYTACFELRADAETRKSYPFDFCLRVRYILDNLLLTDTAQVNTKPQLVIDADDVKCSHGATVGQIDEEAMFYLRSRGIGEAEARMMMMFGFAHEIVGRVKLAPLRDEIDNLVDKRLRGELTKCHNCVMHCKK